MMSSDSPPTSPKTPMARPLCRPLRPTLLADSLVFIAGAFSTLLLFWILSSFISPATPNSFSSTTTSSFSTSSSSFSPSLHSANLSIYPDLFNDTDPNLLRDPPDSTFYDDHTLSYTIDDHMFDWDVKCHHWFSLQSLGPLASSTYAANREAPTRFTGSRVERRWGGAQQLRWAGTMVHR